MSSAHHVSKGARDMANVLQPGRAQPDHPQTTDVWAICVMIHNLADELVVLTDELERLKNKLEGNT